MAPDTYPAPAPAAGPPPNVAAVLAAAAARPVPLARAWSAGRLVAADLVRDGLRYLAAAEAGGAERVAAGRRPLGEAEADALAVANVYLAAAAAAAAIELGAER